MVLLLSGPNPNLGEEVGRAWSGRAGQRLAPNVLGGVGEASPCDSPSKEGDTSTKPELNHVESTTWKTSSYGDPDPGPLHQNHTTKKSKKSSSKEGEDTEDTGPSQAESISIGQNQSESALSSDLDSSEEEEEENCEGPQRKT